MEVVSSIKKIAVIGKPNVGKSTLSNVLTKRKDSLIFDVEGVTRDRVYGAITINDSEHILIDTGGLVKSDDDFDKTIVYQTKLAIDEADIILFVLDGKNGYTSEDEFIAQYLRKQNKPILTIINKVDGLDVSYLTSEFGSVMIGETINTAAVNKRGINNLLQKLSNIIQNIIAEDINENNCNNDVDIVVSNKYQDAIKIALLGKPNVGKSTLTNRLLGWERSIIYDMPGTTRDTLVTPLSKGDDRYILLDTAGIRRKSRTKDNALEKFSIIKALQAIINANVVLILIDAQQGLSTQDLQLLGHALKRGCPTILVVNKWDNLSLKYKNSLKQELSRSLVFADFIKIVFISALHGSNVAKIFSLVKKCYKSSQLDVTSNKLTNLLQKAVQLHNPPIVNTRRIKLRYCHLSPEKRSILTLIVHGTQTDKLPAHYKKYLTRFFMQELHLFSVPLRIIFKNSVNPYA